MKWAPEIFPKEKIKIATIRDPENTIEITIQNDYFDSNEIPQVFPVFKGIKIKDLKKEIIEKILLNENNLNIYNNKNSLERLSLNFNLDDLRQDINKKD